MSWNAGNLDWALSPGPRLLRKGHKEFPHDCDIIVFCSCPNEVTSARFALKLHRQGFTRVRPLLGGIDAWRKESFPVDAWQKDLPKGVVSIPEIPTPFWGLNRIRSPHNINATVNPRSSDVLIRVQLSDGTAQSFIQPDEMKANAIWENLDPARIFAQKRPSLPELTRNRSS